MTINFKPSKKQFEAWTHLTDKTTTELGYGGAASGGKSFLGCFFFLSMCLAYPGIGCLMGRKDLINLKRTTLITFYKVCEEYGVKAGVDFNLNQQTNTITFANGSQIFLFDLSYQPSDPLYTRLGSLELTYAFLDESNEIDAKAIGIVKTRLGRRLNDKYGLTPKLLETFNPDKGHVYADYFKPAQKGTLPAHRKFIKALPTDNPHTTETYLFQLRNSDKMTRARLLEGNFEYDDDPTILIDYDASVDLFSNTVEPGDKYLSADIARYGGDKIVVYLWEGLKVTKVFIRKKLGIDETVGELKRIARDESVPYSRIIVDEDGVGGGVVDGMRGIKGFVANRTPFANRITREDENFGSLKAQCSYKLADMVNDHKMALDLNGISSEDVTVDEFKDCFLQELAMVKTWDADKDGKRKVMPKDEVKAVIGRSPDYSDAFMMRMWFEVSDAPRTEKAVQFRPQLRPRR